MGKKIYNKCEACINWLSVSGIDAKDGDILDNTNGICTKFNGMFTFGYWGETGHIEDLCPEYMDMCSKSKII